MTQSHTPQMITNNHSTLRVNIHQTKSPFGFVLALIIIIIATIGNATIMTLNYIQFTCSGHHRYVL